MIKDTESIATLTKVRDKFLRLAGVQVTRVTQKLDEQTINARVLAPICAIDIAYEKWQQLDKTYFRQNSKRWYNEVNAKFKTIFGTQGILYRDLTEREVMLVNEYMDKIRETTAHDTNILWWQIQGRIMDFPADDRKIATDLIFIITICCFAHDTMNLDLHSEFFELEYIYRRIAFMVADMAEKKIHKHVEEFCFEDDMFTKTLAALFNRINGTKTEGVTI